jgi:hypothetical protein
VPRIRQRRQKRRPRSLASPNLVWGFCCQAVSEAIFLSCFLGRFLCSTRDPVSPSRPAVLPKPARAGAVKVGRRTNLSTRSALARPHLDSSEQGGTLDAVGMTIRGEPACGRAYQRATTLYSVDPRTRTMMQSCASAAKLRGSGPTLFLGTKAIVSAGTPPPRTVIGDPSQADGLGRNWYLQQAPFIAPGAERCHLAPRPLAQAATRRSEACAPRPRSWSCA